jgi:GH24 family phage-related lysozyme (muramidase)
VTYSIDQAGVELIAGFEGFVNGAYNDSRWFATCGYGHLLHQSAATAQDHHTYDGKGRAFFLTLLHGDIQRVSIGPMNRYLHRPMSQGRVNAVASGCFNCGPGFVMGTVGREINAGHWQAAADAFRLWSTPPVLRARREIERALFLKAPKAVKMPWLRADERAWCVEYDRLLKAGKNIGRRRELRTKMALRAAEIRHAAAHEGGWEKADRRHRYHSLKARLG